jgi:hypothetical protein
MFSFNRLKLTALVFPLVVLVACTKEETTKISNYTYDNCHNDSSLKLSRNVVSLATMYHLFNTPLSQGNFAEVNLHNKYATGKNQIISNAFKPHITDRLGYDGLETYNIKVFSLVEMPENTKNKQILKFSQPCQVNNALLENESLRYEPRDAFYLLAGRTNFLMVLDNADVPKPNIPVKFKLFNPESSEIEEATFLMYEITGGDIQVDAPSSWESFLSRLKGETGERKWSLEKHTKNIDGKDYRYFTITRRSATASLVVGEIQDVEFEPGKEN